MGNKLIVAVVVASLTAGAPALMPNSGKADAQSSSCTCSAAFDGINSDLQFVTRYYNRTTLSASPDQCGSACNTWRKDWFYRDACDHPTRINRGTKAIWAFDNSQGETFIGTDNWWCPFPPP